MKMFDVSLVRRCLLYLYHLEHSTEKLKIEERFRSVYGLTNTKAMAVYKNNLKSGINKSKKEG